MSKKLRKLTRIGLTTQWLCTHKYTPRGWEILIPSYAYAPKIGLCIAPHEAVIDGAIDFRLIDAQGRFICSGQIREEFATHEKEKIARSPLFMLSELEAFQEATEMLIRIDDIWHRSEDYV